MPWLASRLAASKAASNVSPGMYLASTQRTARNRGAHFRRRAFLEAHKMADRIILIPLHVTTGERPRPSPWHQVPRARQRSSTYQTNVKLGSVSEPQFRGTWYVLPTPFADDLSLDLNSIGRLIEACINWDVEGLTVMGVTI